MFASVLIVSICKTCIFFLEADVDEHGSIDCLEFILSIMHRHRLKHGNHLCKALQYFDKDNSGRVLQNWYFDVNNGSADNK